MAIKPKINKTKWLPITLTTGTLALIGVGVTLSIVLTQNSENDKTEEEKRNEEENKKGSSSNSSSDGDLKDSLEKLVQNLPTDSLQGIAPKSSVQANDVLDQKIKNSIKGINGLSSIDENKITITINNDSGKIVITINGYGKDKVITLIGFQTQEQRDKIALQAKIQELRADDFTSLVSDIKLPSEVVKGDIKSIEGLYSLLDSNIILQPDDINGNLKIIIDNNENTKELDLTGFQTAAQRQLQIKVQGLTKDNFTSIIDNNKLPSEVFNLDIKNIEGLNGLVETDIILNPNNDNGTLEIIINNHGSSKTVVLDAYQNQAQRDRQILENNIKNLPNNSVEGITPKKDVEAKNVENQEIKNALKAINGLSGIDENKIFISQDNEAGTITITISDYGDDKIITLTGYQTQQQRDWIEQIKSLTVDDFQSLISGNKLPSEIVKANVKDLPNLDFLQDEDIDLDPNIQEGDLKITISNHGDSKQIDLSGFQTKEELKTKTQSLKPDDFKTLISKTKLPSEIKPADIKKTIEGISSLEDRYIDLEPNDNSGALKIKIIKQGDSKEVTLTGFQRYFDWVQEKMRKIFDELDFSKLVSENEPPSKIEKKDVSSIVDNSIWNIIGRSILYKIKLFPNNIKGILKINLEVWFNNMKKTIELTGFQTKPKLQEKAQSLTKDDFAHLISDNKLPSEVVKADIKNIDGLSGLIDADITFVSNDDNGALKIIIINQGPDKEIDLTGFQNKDKLQQKVQSLTKDDFAHLISDNNLPSEVVKADIKTIEGLSGLIDADTTFIHDDYKGTLKITISNHGEPVEFDLSDFQTKEQREVLKQEQKIFAKGLKLEDFENFVNDLGEKDVDELDFQELFDYIDKLWSKNKFYKWEQIIPITKNSVQNRININADNDSGPFEIQIQTPKAKKPKNTYKKIVFINDTPPSDQNNSKSLVSREKNGKYYFFPQRFTPGSEVFLVSSNIPILTGISENDVYKITLSQTAKNHAISSIVGELNWHITYIERANKNNEFEKQDTFLVSPSKDQSQDNPYFKEIILKNSGNGDLKIQFVWNQNADKTWDLNINVYNWNKKGQDDALFSFKTEKQNWSIILQEDTWKETFKTSLGKNEKPSEFSIENVKTKLVEAYSIFNYIDKTNITLTPKDDEQKLEVRLDIDGANTTILIDGFAN